MSDLTRDRNYEIVVIPFNSQGSGPPSPPATVYVGEAVPTGEPQDVVAEPVSSTEVRLNWKPPQQSQQNGDLLGYKVQKLTKNHLICPSPLSLFLLLNLLYIMWSFFHLLHNFSYKSDVGKYLKNTFQLSIFFYLIK